MTLQEEDKELNEMKQALEERDFQEGREGISTILPCELRESLRNPHRGQQTSSPIISEIGSTAMDTALRSTRDTQDRGR